MKRAIGTLFILFSFSAHAAPSPLSLEDGLTKAQESSRDIKSSKATLTASEKEISRANSDYFPTLNLIGDTGTYHDRNPQPGDTVYPLVPRDRNVYQARLEVKEVLFSGFSTSASVQSAKASKRVEEENLNQDREQVRTDFILTYFGVQRARRKIASETEILTLKKSRLDQVMSRRKAGRATELEELQSRLAVQTQEPSINSLKANLENLSLHLNQLLGAEVTSQYRLTDDIEGAAKKLDNAFKVTLTEAFEKAVAQNSSLRSLEAQSDKLAADLKLDDAKNLPTVDIRAFGGLDTYRQDEIGNQNATVYGALVEINAPLFSGLSTFYTAEEKHSKLEAITEKRSKAREKLLEDLQQLYRQIHVNRQNIKARELNVQVARRAVSQADARFSNGRATLIDTLDSYSQKLTAEEALVDDYFQSIQTLSDLNHDRRLTRLGFDIRLGLKPIFFR